MATPTLADSLVAATAAVVAASEAYQAREERVALREAYAVLAAGLATNDADPSELLRSVSRGILANGLGGNPNALAATIPGGVVVPQLEPWTRLRGIAAQTNTSAAVTMTVYGVGSAGGSVSGQLVRRDGSALAVGDIPVGVPFEFQPDGAGKFRLLSATSGDTVTFLASLSITGGRTWIRRSAGTYTLLVPYNVTKAYARAKGGGGKGGDSSYAGNVSSGGAGGGVDEGVFDVIPNSTLTAIVGIGGRPGAPAGATTSITGLYRNGSAVTLYATGGGAGVDGYNGAQQQIPTGGQGYGGDNPRAGQFGGVGLAMKSDNGATLFAGGVGGAAGIEGATTIFALNTGIPGSNPGDGGSGANNQNVGGPGADGEVIIKY